MEQNKLKKVQCPYCGHKVNAFYEKGASSRGVFFKCKNRDCKNKFELRLENG